MLQLFSLQCGKSLRDIEVWHFCDNQIDADICADLVLAGHKRATTSSLWWYQHNDEPLPKVGDLNLITNWHGVAQCIIETKEVQIMPFCDVSQEYASIEGEGDKSLDFWRQVHWAYFTRELGELALKPCEDMPVVCEVFDVVYSLVR